MFNLFKYLHNRFCRFVILDRDNSIITLSRSLYREILLDETRKPCISKPRYGDLFASFWKERTDASRPLSYVFYVNPDWSRHGVSNPELVFSSQILVDPNNHMSIKAMMPTCNEILSVYGVPGSVVELGVNIRHLNGEQYYELSRRAKVLVK